MLFRNTRVSLLHSISIIVVLMLTAPFMMARAQTCQVTIRAGSWFSSGVRVNAGQGFDQSGLAMVNMSGGADDNGFHSANFSLLDKRDCRVRWRAAAREARETEFWCGTHPDRTAESA